MRHPLCKRFGFDGHGRRERLQMIGFEPGDAALGRRLHEEVIAPNQASIIDAFYRYLLDNAQTLAFLEGEVLIARLKQAQSDYLFTLGIDFDGIDYFEGRLRIGMAHARIGLPLSLYQCAYVRLQALILRHVPSHLVRDVETHQALIRFALRITALDMSLATETYHQARLQGLEEHLHDLRAEHARLSWQVQFDDLTQVAARSYVLSVLAEQLSRLPDSRGGLCVIMADLDNFKETNDTYGHVVGDRALQESAARIKGAVRDVDLVGRYGGEEFIIVLPDTTPEMAQGVAERIRGRFHNNPLRIDDVLLPLTISLGYTHARSDDDVDTLVARADQALYRAKDGGRNRVSCYDHAVGN
ncbi:MAG TPA: diguanylate cyclase [Gammaproteobacteria bacterium]|nr:diguanylate cyclase [Gammaproteobacteria bacterium]